MTTSGEWATQADRDAAVRLVDSAWAGGQIFEEDRDRRVANLGRAESKQDVELVVRDLRPPSYEPVPGAGPQPRSLQERTVRARRIPTVALLLVALVVLLAPVVVFLARVGEGSTAVDRSVAVLTEQGYAGLVADVRAETGLTEAFVATLYPEYAALDLPVDATSQRERSWYWDGELVENTQGTTTAERFDLARVDPTVLLRLLNDVRGRIEGATSWYAIVHAPQQDGTVFQVYADNDVRETAYLAATADGTVIYRSGPST